jgi:hypothetical protein
MTQYEIWVKDRNTLFTCFISCKTFELEYLVVYLNTGFAEDEFSHENIYVLPVLISIIARIKNLVLHNLFTSKDSMT